MLTTDKMTQLETEGRELATLLAKFEAVNIQSPEDHAWAAQQMLAVKKQSKDLDTEMKTATKPMNDALNVVRGWFKKVTQPLDQIEAVLKRKIGEYEFAKQQEQQKAVNAAAAAFSQGQGQAGIELLNKVEAATAQKQTGVSVRRVVKFRYTNVNSVPREYCAPVDALVRARVAVDGMKTQIPGVEVFEASVVSGRIA